MRFYEKKKISEIAEILGKSEGTVKSLLSRGLEKLRVFFEEEHNEIPKTDSAYK